MAHNKLWSPAIVGMLVLQIALLFSASSPVAASDTTWESLGTEVTDASAWSIYTTVGGTANQILSNRSTAIITESDNGVFGDSDPGYLYIEATNAADDSFGTSVIYAGVSAPVEEHDYYTLRVQARLFVADCYPVIADGTLDWIQASCGVKLGYRAEDPELGTVYEYVPSAADTYTDIADTTGTGWQTLAQGIMVYEGMSGGYGSLRYAAFSEYASYGRPFSYDEISDLEIVLAWKWTSSFFSFLSYYGQPPVRVAVAQLYAEVLGSDYAPTANPVGSFVLRPDGDIYGTEGWTNDSSGDATDLWACLDETTYRSDMEDSLIYQDPALQTEDWLGLSFTDAPSWASDTRYNATLWFMLGTSDESFTTFEEPVFTVWVSLAGYDPTRTLGYEMYSYFFNWTLDIERPLLDGINPYENVTGFSLTELAALQVAFASELLSGATLNISQVAILCTPVGAAEAAPAEDGTGILQWIRTGGVPTMFGVIGFGLMIAVPAMCVAAYRSGEVSGMRAFVTLVLLWLLGLSFFLVSVYAG